MNTHAEKLQESRNRSAANCAAQKQHSDEFSLQFVDNRPEAITQRKLQEMVNNNLHVKQMKISDTGNIKTGKNTKPVVQRAIKSRKIGTSDTVELANLAAIATEYNTGVPHLARAIKDKLFEGNLFSAAYQNAFTAQSHGIPEEMSAIITGLDPLIAASNSRNQINANDGDANAVGRQIVVILGGAINEAYLNRFPNYNIIHNLGDAERVTSYTNMIAAIMTRIRAYTAQIHLDQYDQASLKTNARMQNRLDKIKNDTIGLRDHLDAAVTAGNDTADIIARVNTLTAELDTLERAWDLDWRDTDMDLDTKIDNLGQTPDVWGQHYQDDGGEDDGMNVGDVYNSNLACTLYSILALKPGWLGAATPGELHRILRKTEKLKEYDDNQIAAKVRYLAGLNPVQVQGNVRLGTYLQQEAQAGRRQSRIFDITGMAHTFAAVWMDNQFRKVDEATPLGGVFSADYNQSRVLWVWE